MSHRFFLDSEIRDGRTILKGDQAHHAIHVMRSKVGDKLVLFDGKGTEHTALIIEAERKKLLLKLESSRATVRAIRRPITIAVALPKGDRQKFLVEKLVEVGVSRLVPLKTTRSVAVATNNVVERMNRHVVEASKQCGRNYLMSVDREHTVQQLISSTTRPAAGFVAHPTADQNITIADNDRSAAAIIAVGPEGGFTADELAEFADANWMNVKLGPTILRIETAAIVAAVLLGMNSEVDP